MSSTFRMPESDIVLEAFQDESIAVNLSVGRYYSLSLVGAEIYDLLTQGCALEAVVEHLAHRYDEDPAVIDDAVRDFTARLLEEGLIVAAPEEDAGSPLPAPERSSVGFSTPTMSVYTDMEDLLLLDPIHDVDETGWPVRADAAEPAPSELHDAG